ncbi:MULTISPECIES: sigma-70 family RNA polymerase sigma factor [unclassified Virgibacillus]|uniref:sigma-70 family RNA polymerase sigma factor n=1 Tax=unclassified Virgibacillus TaxID=2620237 RepID=UPI0024DE4529|nr:sigma-70 family RNA polymerase sigma factor [Virgibacillus sp. LDC-1]
MRTNQEKFTFEEVFKQNKNRIHYHINRLNIHDPHEEYFQEGLFALWNAYEKYEPDKGPLATYFNYTIRNRLIDQIRKESRRMEKESIVCEENRKQYDNGNRHRRTEVSYPMIENNGITVNNPELWDRLKEQLTDNQWKWVSLFIIENMSIKEIAAKEGKTEEAVKSWGKQVRKKLRNDDFRKKIKLDVTD